MKNLDNLCMNCFEELTQGSVCANCDYDNDTQTSFVYLQPKTILNDRYAIGAFVSHESDAATYMAYDMQELKVVTVREFLPKGIAARLEGSVDVHVRERFKPSFDKLKNSFIRLWETISELKNLSAVIPTYDVFELNSTAYAVSEYMETISLREFLLRNPDGNILCLLLLKHFIQKVLFTVVFALITLCFAGTVRLGLKVFALLRQILCQVSLNLM